MMTFETYLKEFNCIVKDMFLKRSNMALFGFLGQIE